MTAWTRGVEPVDDGTRQAHLAFGELLALGVGGGLLVADRDRRDDGDGLGAGFDGHLLVRGERRAECEHSGTERERDHEREEGLEPGELVHRRHPKKLWLTTITFGSLLLPEVSVATIVRVNGPIDAARGLGRTCTSTFPY